MTNLLNQYIDATDMRNLLSLNKKSSQSRSEKLQYVKWLKQIEDNHIWLYNLPDKFRNDYRINMTAIRVNPKQFQYASYKIKNDKNLVKKLVTEVDPFLLEFASEDVKNDFDVVLAAVTHCGFTLRYASKDRQDDDDIVLAAVTQDGGALRFASDRLKDDKTTVLEAVKSNWMAFSYVSKRLQQNRDVVLNCVKNNISGYQAIVDTPSNAIKNDREILLEAVKKGGFRVLRWITTRENRHIFEDPEFQQYLIDIF